MRVDDNREEVKIRPKLTLTTLLWCAGPTVGSESNFKPYTNFILNNGYIFTIIQFIFIFYFKKNGNLNKPNSP